MELMYLKSKWEVWHVALEPFLERVKGSGFDGTEIFIPSLSEAPEEVTALHKQYELKLVAQIVTIGNDPDAHLRSLEERFEVAVQCKPLLINGHTGRDIFPFEDNVRILRRAIALSQEHGVPFVNETHRGRPTYSAITTREYLEALPELRLTADFSHWMVVHESDLRDQEGNVQLAIERSNHIHARVGYEEGPQVTDPRAPEWQPHLENHLSLWRQIVDRHRQEGAQRLTITPEFGPPTYMHTLPFTNQPVADVWEINVYMKDLLKQELGV